MLARTTKCQVSGDCEVEFERIIGRPLLADNTEGEPFEYVCLADVVGVKDVAARADVSVGTVSNVLNRPEIVSEAPRSLVMAAIDELAFVRNESARKLSPGRSRTIGLIVLDVGNSSFTDLARVTGGAEDVTDEAGLLCRSRQ